MTIDQDDVIEVAPAPRRPTNVAVRRISWVVLAVVIVASLVASIVEVVRWPASAAAHHSTVPLHGLTANQAACFTLSMIERRTDVRLRASEYPETHRLDRTFRFALHDEAAQIAKLAKVYPDADQSLLGIIGGIAMSTSGLAVSGKKYAAQEVEQHHIAVARGASACESLGSFDVRSARPAS